MLFNIVDDSIQRYFLRIQYSKKLFSSKIKLTKNDSPDRKFILSKQFCMFSAFNKYNRITLSDTKNRSRIIMQDHLIKLRPFLIENNMFQFDRLKSNISTKEMIKLCCDTYCWLVQIKNFTRIWTNVKRQRVQQ